MEDLSPEFMKRHNIPTRMISRKWTQEEIYSGLDEMAKLFHPEFEPITKNLSKDLSSLIYNPISRTSMFLRVKCSPPQTLQKKFSVSRDPKVKRISDEIMGMYPKVQSHDLPVINRVGKEIVKYHRTIKKDEWGEVKSVIPTPLVLTNQYIEWLKRRGRIPPPFSLLPSSGSFWEWFCHELQNSLGVDFSTGGEYGTKD